MPTKTAVKEKVNGTAVEEAEEGTTPTPAPAASTKKKPVEEEPAKSSESDASADDAPQASAEPADGDDAEKASSKSKAPKPPSLVDIQRSLYKDTSVDLWVSPEIEVKPEGAKESRKISFVFPRMSTITPNRQFLRKIYNLEPLFQYFEWMNLAQIPPFIQDLTDGLDDVQFNDLFDGWFTDSEIDDPKE
jgi:hypothetical protein